MLVDFEKVRYLSRSDAQTRALGEKLTRRLRPGDLITLSGAMGAGKTTFVQGLGSGLGLNEPTTSPTFVLIIEHEGKLPLLHLDAYRLSTNCYDAIRDAGVMEFLDREDAVKVVEWPEHVADFLPEPRFQVVILPGDDIDDRHLEILERQA